MFVSVRVVAGTYEEAELAVVAAELDGGGEGGGGEEDGGGTDDGGLHNERSTDSGKERKKRSDA